MPFQVNINTQEFKKNLKQIYNISLLKVKNAMAPITSKIWDIVLLPHSELNPKFGPNWLRIVGVMTK